ncbi:MAG: CPBP family intramembrane glutamic endopeptidase [Planctomycetota bacterium]
MESCPTQAVLPLVGLAAEKVIRDRYNKTKRGSGTSRDGRGMMDKQLTDNPMRFAMLAVLFELSLGGLAVILGWLGGVWPWRTLVSLNRSAWIVGSMAGGAAAIVLFAGIVMVDRKPVGIFRQLQATVRRYVAPLFRNVNPGLLFVISLSAGVGEEFLFRGCCQAIVAGWIGSPWGDFGALVVASALFGVCHWISKAYALVASAMGFVLGGLFWATGSLLAPIVAHSLYDFLALLYLTRFPGMKKTAIRPERHEPP